jgi:hypothetical protein
MNSCVFLVAAGIIIFFIMIDFVYRRYNFHKLSDYREKKDIKSEPPMLIPNLRIWGLGAILAVEWVMLYYLLSFLKAVMPTENSIWHKIIMDAFNKTNVWTIAVMPLSIMAFMSVLIGLFLWAIIRVVRED